MGIEYSTTIGTGFEVTYEEIKQFPGFDPEEHWAEEFMDELIWGNYKHLELTTAHGYDAGQEETKYVVTVKRLTESYDLHENCNLTILGEKPKVTYAELFEVNEFQRIYGIKRPLVQFVASAIF